VKSSLGLRHRSLGLLFSTLLGWGMVARGALSQSRGAQNVQPPDTPALSPEADYIVAPGDVLQVFVWKEGELSRDVTVRMDGKITVPLLGDVPASGQTPQQLAAELERSYARFLASPQVTVGVGQANSRFYVLGQVARAGDFPLTGPMTVLQGLALAGGLREFAKGDKIVIVRHENGRDRFIPVNYKRLEDATDIAQNVVLRSGDTILVP
jgi:polysaccharide biosynthesis/export protein